MNRNKVDEERRAGHIQEMRIRFPILLSAAILVAAILLVFRDELHARGPHTLNRLDGSVTQCDRSQQNFSPAIATVGLKSK